MWPCENGTRKMSNCNSNCNRRPHALRTNERGRNGGPEMAVMYVGSRYKTEPQQHVSWRQEQSRKMGIGGFHPFPPVPVSDSTQLDTGFVIADSCGQPWWHLNITGFCSPLRLLCNAWVHWLCTWEAKGLKDPGSDADIAQQCRQDLQPLLGLHLAGVICFGHRSRAKHFLAKTWEAKSFSSLGITYILKIYFNLQR